MRAGGADGRWILKSARMLLLEMHSEAVMVLLSAIMVLLSAILLGLCLDYLHEDQRVSLGNGIKVFDASGRRSGW